MNATVKVEVIQVPNYSKMAEESKRILDKLTTTNAELEEAQIVRGANIMTKIEAYCYHAIKSSGYYDNPKNDKYYRVVLYTNYKSIRLLISANGNCVYDGFYDGCGSYDGLTRERVLKTRERVLKSFMPEIAEHWAASKKNFLSTLEKEIVKEKDMAHSTNKTLIKNLETLDGFVL